jgi:hypothetical protein
MLDATDTEDESMTTPLKTIDKALRAATRKMHFRSDAQLKRNLEFACMDTMEAYKLGVEECQGEIVRRLQEIQRTITPPVGEPQ